MNEQNYWTIKSLKDGLVDGQDQNSDEFTCYIDDNNPDVLQVELEPAGGIKFFVAISENQLITSTILWPCSQQKDREAFEAMMLRTHKDLLPLCALSICRIDDEEYYELFGSMAADSSLESIKSEIRTVANNALELAHEIGPNSSFNS